MKYKKGQIVYIKSMNWLRKYATRDKDFRGYSYKKSTYLFVDDMTVFCGRRVTIRDSYYNIYHVNEDHNKWIWQKWMFQEHNVVKEMNDLLEE